jgi:tetratricopeptide (TPR) repeat protein
LLKGAQNVDERIPPEGRKGFLGAELTRQDAREAVRRMLTGSPKRPFPQDHKHRFHPRGAADGDTGRYDRAFHATESRLAEAQERTKKQRQLAGAQWSSLESHPPARRLVMVLNDERLHHWGLYHLLVEKSRYVAANDPAAAVSLAVLALAVADRLDPQVYGAERVADFKTCALAVLGDARRVAGDLAGARLAFSQARINLEMGTGDLLEEANLLAGLVNLLCDLGEYEKAAESLERAHALFRRLGDPRLEGISVHPSKAEETGEAKDRQDQRIG